MPAELEWWPFRASVSRFDTGSIQAMLANVESFIDCLQVPSLERNVFEGSRGPNAPAG